MYSPDGTTIAAIATPPGEGALAIVRLSGRDAFRIADVVFRGSTTLSDAAGHTVHHGAILSSSGSVVDEVLATVYRAPRSYTGEDSVEFSCHGGMLVTRQILDTLLGAGARQAGPGEFTRRGFLNGKMDLTQAEAVAALITARSESARRVSMEQLEGKLGTRVGELRAQLTHLCALLELELDFSEEGVELVGRQEIEKRILAVDGVVAEMIHGYEEGRIAREGVAVVLAGRPNAGKSSLFNALLREERAIVAPLPGTTRDTLEENITVNGILFRVIDTAGIRTSTDIAEAEGVSRAVRSAKNAQVVLLVEDVSQQVEESEIAIILHNLQEGQHLIVACNKVDLPAGPVDLDALGKYRSLGARFVRTSAITGIGIAELRNALAETVITRSVEARQGPTAVNRRHRDALQRARESLRASLDTLRAGHSNEFIALDVRQAANALSEITGEIVSEDILNAVFSVFCIGK